MPRAMGEIFHPTSMTVYTTNAAMNLTYCLHTSCPDCNLRDLETRAPRGPARFYASRCRFTSAYQGLTGPRSSRKVRAGGGLQAPDVPVL